MADDFAAEIKWWKNRAASFDQKRANLKPISFDYVSKAASNKGNYNAASTFNSARARLFAEDQSLRSRMVYTPPTAAGKTPKFDTVLKPSENVVKLANQNDTTAEKIKELGGNAFRGAVGGLMRVADLVSRTGYAIRSTSMVYAKENAASNGTSLAEHAENALRPIFDIATLAPRVVGNAATGNSDKAYHAMWEGFSGRSKTSGHDLMKVAFPEFTSDHKKWTSVLSFGVDVVYDPLSWVTLGQGTVVTGAAKGTAAAGAAAVGKKAMSKSLLSNTVWTATGRAGGKEAVRESIYLRAGKPYFKQNAKASKAVTKLENTAEKAAYKGQTDKAVSAYSRIEKAKQVRDAVHAENAAKIEAVLSESYTGMNLAWKAVANKSLGLGSIQAYGKGVNTAGTGGRAARELKAMQDAGRASIVSRFTSADSMESQAWRKAHQDLIDNGVTTIEYKHGGVVKTFDITEDYDEFVDTFTGKLFPSRPVTGVSKKDVAAHRGLSRADDREAKALHGAFHEELRKVSEASSKDLISPFRIKGAGGPKAKAVPHAQGVASAKRGREAAVDLREDLLKPKAGETPAMAQMRVFDDAAEKAKDDYIAVLKQADEESKAGLTTASVKYAEATELANKARVLAHAATKAREVAESDLAVIDAAVGDWMLRNADTLARNDDEVVASLSARPGAVDTMDQINGHGPQATHTRDRVMGASAQSIVNQINAGVEAQVKGVVEAAGGTLEGGKIEGLVGMQVGTPAANVYARQINHAIARAIQDVYKLAQEQEIVARMDDDYELAWDAIQNNTNSIINQLFGANHLEIFVALEAHALSIMPDTPSVAQMNASIANLFGDTLTPMTDVLARDSLLSDIPSKTGGAYNFRQKTMDKLRAAVPKALQDTHTRAVSYFHSVSGSFSWQRITKDWNDLVEVEGIDNAVNRIVEDAQKLVTPSATGRVRLPSSPTRRMSDGMHSMADIFDEWVILSGEVIKRTHGVDDPSVGQYSLYDYWTFGDNAGKETQAVTNVSRSAAQADSSLDAAYADGLGDRLEAAIHKGDVRSGDKAERMAAGRAGYLQTKQNLRMRVRTLEEDGIVNEALDTIPAMDERLLELTSHVRGWIAGGAEGLDKFAQQYAPLREAVGKFLVPDMQRLTTGDDFATVNPAKLMETLGSHVYLLSDTTMDVNTSVQVALAREVWGRSTKLRQLNESIMLFNLHNTLVMGLGPEAAAARIAEVVKNYPSVSAKMGEAHALKTTNGAVGARKPPAADIGHIRNQAKAAAEESMAAWDAANPVEAAAPAKAVERQIPSTPEGKTIDEFVGKPAVQESIKNMPVQIADKFDTLTEADAPVYMGGLDTKGHKFWALGKSGLAIVRGPADSKNGIRFYIARAGKLTDRVAKDGGMKGDDFFEIRVRHSDVEAAGNDVYVDELASQILDSRKANAAPAGKVDDTARQAARQAEYDRVYNAKVDELKAAATPEPAPVLSAEEAAKGAALQLKQNKFKTALENAKQNEAAAATATADAAKHKQDALLVKEGAENEVAASAKQLAEAEAIDSRVAAGATPTNPADAFNRPGGHTVEIDDEVIKEIDTLIEQFDSYLDIHKINESLEYAQVTMNQGMAEYAQLMKEAEQQFGIQTRYMLKFAGIPIMPVASARSPMAAYAGMVAMKESQGRVHNWLRTGNFTQELNARARRPSSMHDAVLEDMRRSLANNAINWLQASHKSIRETYGAYKNKAARQADIKAWWDPSNVTSPVGLKMLDDRLKRVSDELFGRTIRTTKITEPNPKLWGDKELAEFNKAMQYQLQTMNEALPSPYRLPDDVFAVGGAKAFASDKEAWSREWLLELSKWLDKDNANHVLAAKNIHKIDNASFDYAVQNAVSRVKLNTALHDSMFDNFSFNYTEAQIKVLNEGLPKDLQYVRLDSLFNTHKIFGDMAERYVSADIGKEMQKISEYVYNQARGRGNDLNFTMFNKINNYWKGAVTTMNVPRYHIGNVMSDGFLSLMDGVMPASYQKAGTVMVHSHEVFGRIKADPAGYDSMLHPDLTNVDINNERLIATAAGEMGNPRRAMHISTIRVQGKTVALSSEDYYKAYMDFGLSQTQVNGNLLSTTGSPNKAKQVSDYVLDLSNGREDYFRMAHFIHAVENEAKIGSRSQAEIFKAARDRVIKYHFDYGDVSEFERNTVGRFLPFYKWTRNIVPLAMTQLVTNPKTYVINNAANQAMGEYMFPTQEDANGNVIPFTYVVPSWVGDANLVPIGSYTDPDSNEQARYAVLNLPLDQALANWIMPFVDPLFDPTTSATEKVNNSFIGGIQSVVSASHPLGKAAIQAATGKTVTPGDSFENPNKNAWWQGLVSTLVPGSPQFLQSQSDASRGRPMDATYAADNLLGIIRETSATEGTSTGELRKQADMMQPQLVKQAAIWMSKQYPDIDPKSDEGKKILHDFYVQRGVVSK